MIAHRSTAFPALRLRSVARTYPSGIHLVSPARPRVHYMRIQNRGNQSVFFWYGRVPDSNGDPLPLSPLDWTSQQISAASDLMQDFGEEIASGALFEPRVTHLSEVYSLVTSGTNRSHVLIGEFDDQESTAFSPDGY